MYIVWMVEQLIRVLLQEDATVAKTAFLSFLSISQSSLLRNCSCGARTLAAIRVKVNTIHGCSWVQCRKYSSRKPAFLSQASPTTSTIKRTCLALFQRCIAVQNLKSYTRSKKNYSIEYLHDTISGHFGVVNLAAHTYSMWVCECACVCVCECACVCVWMCVSLLEVVSLQS